MNLLFCACPCPIYWLFTTDGYPDAFVPIPPAVNKVPDYTSCTNKNDCTITCARHALDKKTRVDIITMNAAPTNVFLDSVSAGFRAAFQQQRLHKPSIVFVNVSQ